MFKQTIFIAFPQSPPSMLLLHTVSKQARQLICAVPEIRSHRDDSLFAFLSCKLVLISLFRFSKLVGSAKILVFSNFDPYPKPSKIKLKFWDLQTKILFKAFEAFPEQNQKRSPSYLESFKLKPKETVPQTTRDGQNVKGVLYVRQILRIAAMGSDDQLTDCLHLSVLTERPTTGGKRECGKPRDDLRQGELQ